MRWILCWILVLGGASGRVQADGLGVRLFHSILPKQISLHFSVQLSGQFSLRFSDRFFDCVWGSTCQVVNAVFVAGLKTFL